MDSMSGKKDKNLGDISATSGTGKPGKKLLIIDDNREIIEALGSILKQRYDVLAAGTYDEAKEQLEDDVVVILLDIKMADYDGIDVFKKLKAIREDLKIIFHSAYPGSTEKGADAESLEHDGYLTKGEYTTDQLFDLIDKALSKT